MFIFVKTNFMNKVQFLIQKNGLKIGHVAEQIEITQPHFSSLLNGNKPVTEKVRRRLSKFFGEDIKLIDKKFEDVK
jgi:plasmid maintenance system antidote protein VapI